jgi:hypothetical protein
LYGARERPQAPRLDAAFANLFNFYALMKYLFVLVLGVALSQPTHAQQPTPAQAAPAQATPGHPALRPTARPNMQRPQAGAPIGTQPTEGKALSTADSAKLKAAFKELYSSIRPAQTMKERTDMALRRMDRMFKMQGIDSAKAHDSVMAAINMNQDEALLFNAYADAFTADEIKSLATFFKTPAGKHYLEVEPRLIGAKSQVDQYIQRTVNMVTMPMRKPVEHKEGTPGAPGMRPRPGMRPGGAPVPTPPEPAPAPTNESH